MHDLIKLKEMLCKELEEYGAKGVTAGSLETVDKLAHAIKNIEKIIDAEEGYSGFYPYAYADGNMNGSYRDGNSYRSYRGGSYRGSYRGRNRDSMGRYSGNGYSRDGELVEELRGLMEDAPNENVKREMQRLVDKIEQM